jgi:hypothetical protein
MIAQRLRSLIVVLALEWELCSQDPFVFCYRMGCMAFVSPPGDTASPVNTVNPVN